MRWDNMRQLLDVSEIDASLHSDLHYTVQREGERFRERMTPRDKGRSRDRGTKRGRERERSTQYSSVNIHHSSTTETKITIFIFAPHVSALIFCSRRVLLFVLYGNRRVPMQLPGPPVVHSTCRYSACECVCVCAVLYMCEFTVLCVCVNAVCCALPPHPIRLLHLRSNLKYNVHSFIRISWNEKKWNEMNW